MKSDNYDRARSRLLGLLIIGIFALISGCATLISDQQKTTVYVEKRDVIEQVKLAQAAQANDDIKAANVAFEAALALRPRSPNTLNHYAIFLREQWRIDDAKTAYLQALSLAPEHAITHYNLAVLYELYLGDASNALAHYRAYRSYAEQADPKVAAWIAVLERQLALTP